MWAFTAICEVTKRLFQILRIFPLAREKADANRAPLPGPCRIGKRASDVQSGRSSGVEHNLAKVGVEGSNPFARSTFLTADVRPCLEKLPEITIFVA
ncbi:MAG: hypothetical protein RL519_1477 [Pseudomonadota bacterium]